MKGIFRGFLHARREDLGQSMVELALLLPILVFGLLGGADLARAYALQLAVQNGARAGAESYAINFNPTEADAAFRAMDEMSRTPGMNAAFATIFVDTHQLDGVTDCIVSPPTVVAPCFVTVTVQYTFRTIVPWPLVPNVANLNRSTTMRMFY